MRTDTAPTIRDVEEARERLRGVARETPVYASETLSRMTDREVWLKAGIMEIPDVIAINKSDHPAAKTMLNEVRSILTLPGGKERPWMPPIVLTEAARDEHVPELWEKVESHRAHLEETGLLDTRRRENLRGEVFELASARAKSHLERSVDGDPELARLLEQVHSRRLDPLTAVREIMEKVFRLEDGDGAHAG